MKFSKIKGLALGAALGAIGLLPTGANAGITATAGDVILGFRASGGTGSATNYTVKLGQASQFTGATGSFAVSGLGSIATDLAAIYGSGWHTRTDLFFGVIGATDSFSAVGGDAAKTVYASKVRPSASTVATAWNRASDTAQGTATSKVNGLRSGLANGTTSANSTVAVSRATTDLNSWSSYLGGGASYGLYNPTIEAVPASSVDFFKMTPGSGAGAHLGSFSLRSDGSVLFVTATEYSDYVGTTGVFATGGTIQLAASQVVVASAAARTATITITRTGGLAAASVSVASAASSPVSAVAGTDYISFAATMNFAVGETSKTVTVTVSAAPATTKKFLVNLSSPSVATLGAQTSTTVRLQGLAADSTLPVLAIVKPAASPVANVDEIVGIKTLEISGTVTEANLESVTVSINGGAAVNAPITTTAGNKTWKLVINAANVAVAGAALQPGVNTVTATATDLDGNITTTAARSFKYIVKRVLTVAPAGSGAGALTFSPTLGAGSLAIVGQSYTVTATPNVTSFFSSWSSSGSPAISFSTTTARTTTFTFATGQTLIPTYLGTPFTTNVVGLYNGIVKGSTTATDTQTNAGSFAATVSLNTGAFSGKLILDGVTAPVVGVFNNVSKSFTSPTVANGYVCSLTINDTATPRTITGTVTKYKRSVAVSVLSVNAIQANTTFTGGPFVVAFSTPVSPAPDLLDDEYPHGNGLATITIGAKGVATVKGTLADGTAFTSASTVSATMFGSLPKIPVFASFASRTGSIVGEAQIDGASVVGNAFRWFRSANASQYYPYGYANGDTTGLTIHIAAGNSTFGSTLPATVTFRRGEFDASSQMVNVGAGTSTAATAKMVITAGIIKGEWAGNSTYPGKHIIGGVNVNGTNYGYILSPLRDHTDGAGQGSLVIFP